MSQRAAKPFNGLLLPSIGEKSGQLTSFGGPWLVDLAHLFVCMFQEIDHTRYMVVFDLHC